MATNFLPQHWCYAVSLDQAASLQRDAALHSWTGEILAAPASEDGYSLALQLARQEGHGDSGLVVLVFQALRLPDDTLAIPHKTVEAGLWLTHYLPARVVEVLSPGCRAPVSKAS